MLYIVEHEDMSRSSGNSRMSLNVGSLTGEGTPRSTGWFEVTLANGDLVHSKKHGDGFVDSEKKWKKICEGIEKLL
ncbi:Selenoprotein W [Paragonimus heterotremus]|uniref:Selenoprotein W n=1 Tax=Paragonimus heterotremus TaxID=100268 RepID=A0A8J4WQF1_9TREM|nr:Selenoprotein W [Paragonimus heterotremus]